MRLVHTGCNVLAPLLLRIPPVLVVVSDRPSSMKPFIHPGRRIDPLAPARGVRDIYHRVRSGRHPSKLTLAIVGFPKCGTTTLHQSLMATGRFTGIEDEIRPKQFLSTCARGTPHSLIKNPNLVYQPWWIHTIDRVAGPSKFLICLRDPREMLYSFYWYRRRELDDRAAWITERSRPTQIPTEEMVMRGEAELLLAGRNRVDYATWLRHLLGFLPASRILCVVLEQLKQAPREVESALDEFVGFETGMVDHFVMANANDQKPRQSIANASTPFEQDGFFQRVRNETNALLRDRWGLINSYW